MSLNRREFLKKLGKAAAVAPVLAVAPSLLKGEPTGPNWDGYWDGHKWITLNSVVPLKREGSSAVIDPEYRSGHGVMTRAQFQKDMQKSLDELFEEIYKECPTQRYITI